jgi:hypothetical protein
MHLDARDYPVGHLLTEAVAEKLGIYVNVAHFVDHDGRRIFRMIIDNELNKKQMRELLFSTVKDKDGTYEFAYLETITGPVVDQGPRRAEETTYLRVTFM